MAVDSKSIAYAPLTNDSPDTITPPFDDWDGAGAGGGGQPHANVAAAADPQTSSMRASVSTPSALTTTRVPVPPLGWTSLEQDDTTAGEDVDGDRSIEGVNGHERARLLPPTGGGRAGGPCSHGNAVGGSLLAVPVGHALAITTPTTAPAVIGKYAHQLPPRPRPRLGHQRTLSPPKTTIGRPFSSSLSRLPLLASSARQTDYATPFDSPWHYNLYEAHDDELKYRPRTYSNDCKMPAYGPGGRTLVKGATVTTASPRGSCNSPSTSQPKHGRSCDLTLSARQTSVDDETTSLRTYNNPIAQVSSDILRVSGYTNQFRNLLTNKSSARRESGPATFQKQHSDASYKSEPVGGGGGADGEPDEKRNGGVSFALLEQRSGAHSRTGSVRVVHGAVHRRQSGYGIAISSDSTAKMRCRQRKLLFIKRNKICDLSLALAIVGIALAILDAELTALNAETKVDKEHPVSLLLRCLCVVSTLFLMVFLFIYHAIEVKIALIDSGADDWRVALTTERIVKLTLEMIVCAICPLPGTGYLQWPFISPETHKVKMVQVPVDVLLSVPMFLRSYLLCRFMVLHSKQFQDAATRSIAALNRISMDFRFVIKTMMADHPLRVLIVFTVSYWICMSWMFTQCERYDGELAVEHYYLNSLWFVMVTFMSIGYGDIVPNTYCGRTLSIATGIVGAGVSSALIAVISRKLELSRAEKHVNNFMADSKLTNQRKNAAAAVLQQTWFIHKFKTTMRRGKSDDLRLRHHQRRFLQAINEFRRIKWDQRKLQEKGNSLLDVGKLHNEMHETLWEMHKTQDHLISQVDFLTQKIVALQNTLLSQHQPQQPQEPQSNVLIPSLVGIGGVPRLGLTNQLPPSSGVSQSASANAIVHLPVPNSSGSIAVPMNLIDESII